MLESIDISNYALIDRTEIGLNRGFTVITGETGAGKSILLGAIALTLGQRADSSVIQDKSKKCVVEITSTMLPLFSFVGMKILKSCHQMLAKFMISANKNSKLPPTFLEVICHQSGRTICSTLIKDVNSGKT